VQPKIKQTQMHSGNEPIPPEMCSVIQKSCNKNACNKLFERVIKLAGDSVT